MVETLAAQKSASTHSFWYGLLLIIGFILLTVAIVWALAMHPTYTAAWYVRIPDPTG